ncbi:MAG: hypothetical protein II243_02850 [Lachnospiraceae bacterium]|nr:hypothetical protein [Lachnospiraceae bacterium]MBQ1993386.1 hypothetical protein [Lachnospiraceae bacterium]MBQ2405467.1 hypothetical protein [Lachnospiraceae bacterium]MEE0918846.1 hypothetical protein [Lachnospiraceae bacterium]
MSDKFKITLIILLCLDFAAFVGTIICIFAFSDIISVSIVIIGFLFEIITFYTIFKNLSVSDNLSQAGLYSDNLVDTLNKKVLEREFKIQRLEEEIRRLREDEKNN